MHPTRSIPTKPCNCLSDSAVRRLAARRDIDKPHSQRRITLPQSDKLAVPPAAHTAHSPVEIIVTELAPQRHDGQNRVVELSSSPQLTVGARLAKTCLGERQSKRSRVAITHKIDKLTPTLLLHSTRRHPPILLLLALDITLPRRLGCLSLSARPFRMQHLVGLCVLAKQGIE